MILCYVAIIFLALMFLYGVISYLKIKAECDQIRQDLFNDNLTNNHWSNKDEKRQTNFDGTEK